MQHRRAEQKVDTGPDKSPERRAECKRRGSHPGFELLRQPQAEQREIAAEETQHAEPRNKWREPIRQIKRPAEAADNRHRHAEEVNRQRLLAADPLGPPPPPE